jgi:hypothetical protein
VLLLLGWASLASPHRVEVISPSGYTFSRLHDDAPPNEKGYPAQMWLPFAVSERARAGRVIRLAWWGSVKGRPAQEFFSASRDVSGQKPLAYCPVPCLVSYMGDAARDVDLVRGADGLLIRGGSWLPSDGSAEDGQFQIAVKNRPPGQAWMVTGDEPSSVASFLGSDHVPAHFNYTSFCSLESDFPVFAHGAVLDRQQLERLPGFRGRTGKVLCAPGVCNFQHSLGHATSSLVDLLGPGWVDTSAGAAQERARFKFEVIIQDTFCTDFVGEALYQALQAGVLVVYEGAWNIDQYLIPGEKMIIQLSDWEDNLEGLAKHLKHLDANETAYMEYFAWRRHLDAPIAMPPLKEEVLGAPGTDDLCFFCQLILKDLITREMGIHLPPKIARKDRSCCDKKTRNGCERVEARFAGPVRPNERH